jgi:hypothetical protein
VFGPFGCTSSHFYLLPLLHSKYSRGVKILLGVCNKRLEKAQKVIVAKVFRFHRASLCVVSRDVCVLATSFIHSQGITLTFIFATKGLCERRAGSIVCCCVYPSSQIGIVRSSCCVAGARNKETSVKDLRQSEEAFNFRSPCQQCV